MPIKKKKFIDKKKAVSFHLVHRSQKDPLAADESAPQHVLLECKNQEKPESKKQRKEEEQKYGIYYDDDYNYLQHLKDVNSVPEWEPVIDRFHVGVGNSQNEDAPGSRKAQFSLNLPSSVFQSHVEESEGLLNKAAPSKGPRPDWDPDIVAALDDDFDFKNSENELEDDFIALANPQGSDQDEQISSENDGSDYEDSELSFGSEEFKTRFTNYSMSSSVLPRSENLQAVDDHFEKFYEQYDDEDIGPLDCDEIQGYIKPDSDLLLQLAKDFEGSKDKGALKNIIVPRSEMDVVNQNESASSDEELMEITVQERPTEKWDCESVISTYSTTCNRPKLISEPKKIQRVELINGLPRDTLRTKGLTDRLLKKLEKETSEVSQGMKSISSRVTTATSIRQKNETPEERKERKSVVKQIRRDRRAEKKANKLAFKEEEKRQEKVLINLRQNLNGIKLL